MKKISTDKPKSKWSDPEFRREYNRKWLLAKKKAKRSGLATVEGFPKTVISPADQKQKWREAAKARKEASQVHPLFLDKCPGCGTEFFAKLNGKYQPMKLDRCVTPCSMRFYFAKTVN